jgi:hypothetical protein
MVAAAHLEEDDAQEELGVMRLGAGGTVGGVEVGEVEVSDGLSDGSGEVVGRKALFDVTASGVLVVPGGRAEAGPWVVRGMWFG